MTEKELNKIVQNGTLVLLPYSSRNWLKSFEFMFGECILVEDKYEENYLREFNKKVNDVGLKSLIVVDYNDTYRDIIPFISTKTTIKWLMTYSIASLTNGAIMNVLRNLLEFYDRDLISEIGCFDKSLYSSLKKAGYPIFHLLPDFEYSQKALCNSSDMAIISDDYNPNHSYYNMLSALKLVDYNQIKLIANMPATKKFIIDFGIKAKELSDFNELKNGNMLNLYVNFTNTEICLVLESLDNGIPCLVGNTDLFDNNAYLKEKLVLNSDDDVSEIAFKINDVLKNREKILDEYIKFRKKYIEQSKQTVMKFL